MLSVILPASNEADWIGPCLNALFASDPVEGEVIVVANGCRDRTADVARGFEGATNGWTLRVVELAQGGKPLALNAGDAVARGGMRVYLDADVIVSPPLMAQVVDALSGNAPRYVSGRPEVLATGAVARHYARFWQALPFARTPAPGFGLFAVNAAGRARWGEYPDLLSDDTFVRLQFEPHERHEVDASYSWPMVEGFAALTRVRRRQDAGVAQIAQRWPHLLVREAKPRPELARLMLRDPAGFATYAAVSLATRMGRTSGWVRGR